MRSEIDDATSNLRQFIDRQSFDPERMEELNSKLEVFHRLAVNTVLNQKYLKKSTKSTDSYTIN